MVGSRVNQVGEGVLMRSNDLHRTQSSSNCGTTLALYQPDFEASPVSGRQLKYLVYLSQALLANGGEPSSGQLRRPDPARRLHSTAVPFVALLPEDHSCFVLRHRHPLFGNLAQLCAH